MALTLTVECSNHQKDDEPRTEQFTLENFDAPVSERIQMHLKQRGWVVQSNGIYIDTYCSKKCAE